MRVSKGNSESGHILIPIIVIIALWYIFMLNFGWIKTTMNQATKDLVAAGNSFQKVISNQTKTK